MMLLLVDKNEEVNPRIMKALYKNFSQVIPTNLPHRDYGGVTVTAGDINIPLSDGTVLAIERKTPDDFLNSIPTRHLFNQVEVMAQNAKYSVIIVTGAFTYGKTDDMCYIRKDDERISTNWTGASVRAAITKIMYSGCPVIFCPEEFYCQAIAEQYSIANQGDTSQGIKKRRIITFPPIDERVEFIAQIPGIGLKLAESLMMFAGKMEGKSDDYGTIASAFHWLSILVQIDKTERPAGWGPAKILAARKFFGLESNQYIAAPKEVTIKKPMDKKGKEQEITLMDIDGTLYQKYIPF